MALFKRRHFRAVLLEWSVYGAALLLIAAIGACQQGEVQGDAPTQGEPAVGLDEPIAEAPAPSPPMAEPPPAEAAESAAPVTPIPEPEFSDALRSQYNGIDLESRSEAQRSGSDPEAMAQAMLGAQESVEGSYRESSEAEIGNERAVVVFLQENLADDSVQAIRTRLEFFRIDGPWQLEWAGEQYRCQAGRGQQDWGKALCS